MTRFLVGSINTPGPWFHHGGEGVTACALDEETGAISRIAASPQIENAIWIASFSGGFLVATERFFENGELAAYDASISPIGCKQTTAGGAICHLALSPDGKTVYAVSYLGGVSVHSLDKNGVQPAHQTMAYEGSGPNQERQEKSHPHQAVISPNGKELYVCDLGSDTIWVHPIAGAKLGPARAIVAPPGSGPRHLVFHPTRPRFYVIGELDGIVRIYGSEDGRLINSIPVLPTGYTGIPSGAAMKWHPSGISVAVSVRGSDNMAVLVDDTLIANFSTRGKSPRDFAFSPSGRWLLALNQDSDSIIPFEFDPFKGLPTGRVGTSLDIGCPVCALF